MRRREFIALFGSAVLARPRGACAQRPANKLYRVGLVFSTSRTSDMAGPDPIHWLASAFVHGLRDLGYEQGRSLIVEPRSAEGKFEQFPEIMRELVSANVEVIVASSNLATRAANNVTKTLPIGTAGNGVPVEDGLVQSLARPGGNVTGLTGDTGPEIAGKRLQLLKELVPNLSRVAVLQSLEQPERTRQAVETLSKKLDIELLKVEHPPTDFTDAFAVIARERPGAIYIFNSTANMAKRHIIVDLVSKIRIPAMYSAREYVEAGGLIGYGVDTPDLYRRAAGYVDRILKGANPADMPVEQPERFQLVINLQTAKALNLTVSPSLLSLAD